MLLLGRILPRADITLRKDCNSHPLGQIEVFEKHKRSSSHKSVVAVDQIAFQFVRQQTRCMGARPSTSGRPQTFRTRPLKVAACR
jgi:hypothetical protein